MVALNCIPMNIAKTIHGLVLNMKKVHETTSNFVQLKHELTLVKQLEDQGSSSRVDALVTNEE